jgi:hypothetical protein
LVIEALTYFLCPTSFYLTRLGVEGYYSYDHTQGHTTVARTLLDEGSARRRELYLTTHNTHNRKTSMPSAGFESAIPAGEQLQTHALVYEHTYSGAERGGAEWSAACDLIRGNKAVDLFPRIKSQAAVCLFLPLDRSTTGIG